MKYRTARKKAEKMLEVTELRGRATTLWTTFPQIPLVSGSVGWGILTIVLGGGPFYKA